MKRNTSSQSADCPRDPRKCGHENVTHATTTAARIALYQILSGSQKREAVGKAWSSVEQIIVMYFLMQSIKAKKLFLSRYPDPMLHLIQIFRQRLAPGCSEPVFGTRHAAFKKFHARNVLRLFQLARMHAEIAVGGLQYAFQI